MSAKFDDMDLMAFADGELSQTEAQRVAIFVESSPEAQSKLAALGYVGQGVQTYLELATDDVEPHFAGMWERVESSIAGLASEESASEVAERPSLVDTLGSRIARWFKGTQGYFATGLCSAAIAVAVVLLIHTPTERIVERAVAVPAGSGMPASLRSTPTSLDYLQVVGGSSTVLTVGGDEKNSPTTIIWVSDIEETPEGPI